MTTDGFSVELKSALCESFNVREDEPGHWTVRSPFVFDDGDNLPSFVTCNQGQWCFTDHGMTVSHLFFDDFQYTDARFNRISQLVANHSARLDEHLAIVLPLSGQPGAHDVGQFLQLIAQVQGVALATQTDHEQTRYVTTVRKSLEARLATADFQENWSPPDLKKLTKATYKADLKMASSAGHDVVLFAASTSDKANVSALTMRQFSKTDSRIKPVLAFQPSRVSSEAVYRFQDEVGDTDAVVPVEPGSYRELYGAIGRLGVEFVDAA